jgi:hypothetical protein
MFCEDVLSGCSLNFHPVCSDFCRADAFLFFQILKNAQIIAFPIQFASGFVFKNYHQTQGH